MHTLRVLGVADIESDQSSTADSGRKENIITLKSEFRWVLEENIKAWLYGGQTKL